ncbi:MAG TPA: hypothetical protein VGN10_02290 [Pyrinomonadaceae bacterium]
MAVTSSSHAGSEPKDMRTSSDAVVEGETPGIALLEITPRPYIEHR